MQDQKVFNNPQEIFAAYAQLMAEWTQGVPGAVLQEMGREFMQAWSNLSLQSLQSPQKWVEMAAKYQRDQMNLWLGVFGLQEADAGHAIAPQRGDRRFTGKEWRENPVFNYLKQSYLLASNMLLQIADNTHLDEQEREKLKFFTRQFVDGLSPSNFAATNPEVIQHAIETNGQSLVDGLKNLIGDIDKGRISMTDESVFKLGENIATTPGAIVFNNELFQLIQYQPTTEKVSNRPLVIIPPFINKFYILDLQPENSFVRYALDQGSTVFMISWVNPGRDHSDLSWDDYIETGVLKAFEVAKTITRANQVNTVAWCVGGTLLASALAVLHARKNTFAGSATFLTTLLDFSEPGELGVFIDETQVAQREKYVKQTGMLPGKDLALIFSLLRANDLIWSYVVNNYLKGRQPEPFDLLYWNSDPTNLPANLYGSYIQDMYLENKLVRAGALTFCAEKIDLRKIDTPCYFLSTMEDHIAPWVATFKALQLFPGPVEFALGASGHIAGVINPPSKNKRHYWINGDRDGNPQHWLETAEQVPGSWWPHWDKWLKAQGGSQKKAPKGLGNAKYKPIEPAPGHYVMERSD